MATPRRFKFTLAPVLRQRQREEDERQRELAEQLRAKLVIENRLRAIHNEIEQGKTDLVGRLGGRVDTNAIRAQANRSMALDLQARKFALELAEVYRRIDAARQRLIEAAKRRKSIERLRDRRYEQWCHELNRRETREAEDLIMTRLAGALGSEKS